MDEPWSLSFIDDENILFTEKPGKIYSLNLKNKKISEIKHDLNFLEYGQGGLLDVLFRGSICLYFLLLRIEVIGLQALQ